MTSEAVFAMNRANKVTVNRRLTVAITIREKIPRQFNVVFETRREKKMRNSREKRKEKRIMANSRHILTNIVYVSVKISFVQFSLSLHQQKL